MVEYILKMKYLVFCVSCVLFYLSPSSPLANPSASRSFTDDPFVDENKFVETGKYIHILYIYYTYIIHILYKYLHAISSDLPFKKRYSRFTTVRKKCDVICVEFTQYPTFACPNPNTTHPQWQTMLIPTPTPHIHKCPLLCVT